MEQSISPKSRTISDFYQKTIAFIINASKTFIFIAICFVSQAWSDSSIFLSPHAMLQEALHNNFEIQSIKLEINNKKMEIKKKYFDKKPSDIRLAREISELLKLENKQQDIIDAVEFETYSKFYACVISKVDTAFSTLHVKFRKEYFLEIQKQWTNGKTSSLEYQNIKTLLQDTINDLNLLQSSHKKNLVQLLLLVRGNIEQRMHIPENIGLNFQNINFQKDKNKLLQNNRNIMEAKLNHHLRQLEKKAILIQYDSKHFIKKSDLQYQLATLNLNKTIQNTLKEHIYRYVDIQDAHSNLKVQNQILETARQQMNDSKVQFAKGLTPKFQWHENTMEFQESRIQYLKALATLNLKKLKYFQLLKTIPTPKQFPKLP